jgi:hypothetical protein
MSRLACVLLLPLATLGCGRSSLPGRSPYDCPLELLDPDGLCASGGDLASGDGVSDGGDLGRDLGGGHLGHEICNNGLDDDGNGLVDCADPACASFPGCQTVHPCNARQPDCSDPACVDNPQCQNLVCKPTVDFGTLRPTNSSATRTVDTTGTSDVAVTPCAPGGAGMVVGELRLTGVADVVLAYQQGKGEDHVFGLFRAGINQGCAANPVNARDVCYDPKSMLTGSHTYQGLAAGHYYLITQPFEAAGRGPVTVTLSTETQREICDNGIDDNGNGLIDCQDSDCVDAPNCVGSECKPDFNEGVLVVNDPPKEVAFNTGGLSARDNLTCQAARGGKDAVVHFTLLESAGILLQWTQTGDHVVGLMRAPPTGQPCDAQQLNCYDPSGRPADTVAWTEQPPGDYELIFKAIRPGEEGSIDAMISAFQNRRVELCHNGIDDDGNGLVDCADPACTGVAGCSAPYCMPDRQLGTLAVGTAQTVELDVQKDGTAGLKTSCARGNGKALVVQLTVPSVGASGGVGLGFDCAETGDHVIDLMAIGGPREPCDVNERVCADPKTLPFGCGYEIPNLQPGTYNVIVQGFAPGTEGTMRLTLSAINDRQLEICNNGIDDDGDGFTDCADRKCATSQYCTHAQCRPDATIDPMPLTGTTVFKQVLTNGNGVHGKSPCASAPGGQGGVVALTLTAAADLTLDFTQIGQHALAVYTNDGTVLPCDDGTVLTCQTSMRNMSGEIKLSNVPAGRYYLLLVGDQPDSASTTYSGEVTIAISGLPHK